MPGQARRPSGSPAAGLIPTVSSSLRSVMMYNHNALTQAISQIEAIGDIQNELVNARSAHAQASKDLQIFRERTAAQGLQLQQTQEELRIVTQKLHGAREQLGQVESRLAAADGKALSEQGLQHTRVQSLESALSGANQQIAELTRRLQLATSAAIAVQRSGNPVTETDILAHSSSRVQALEKRLAALLGLSEQDLTMVTNQLVETLTGPNAGTTLVEIGSQQKTQVFAYFKALRSEFDTVLSAGQSYTSRNATLEATLTTIRDLNAAPAAMRLNIAGTHQMTDRNYPLQDSPVEGEIEMDVERTEAARVARQNSSVGPSTQSQPAALPQQRTPSIQPPDVSRSVGAASSTPTQSTFSAQKTDSPQRKRQRTLTSGGTPEPLPRDHILHVYVRLVTTTYKIQPAGGVPDGEGAAAGQKQLICRLCESRHKDQPDFPVAIFPYDRDTPLTVPSLVDAEPTRTLVQPWIDHIQQKHQKMYNTVMERAKPRPSTTASTSSTS